MNLIVQELVDKSEVMVQTAVSVEGNSGPVWSLMSLVYRRLGERMLSDPLSLGVPPEDVDPKAWPQAVDNCVWKALHLGKAASAQGLPLDERNPFLQAALVLLDLHLPDLSLECAATAEAEGPEMPVELALVRARCAQLKGDAAGGVELLEPPQVPVLDEETGEPVVDAETGEPTGEMMPAPVDDGDDTRVLSLRGNLLLDLGRHADAALCYEKAITSNPQGVILETHLRLGACLMHIARFDAARAAYTRACALAPCCSTWLGVGASSYRLGDLENADLALAEANAWDNKHPLVWAYLTLVNLDSSRDEEASMALRYCFKEGMEDPGLLEEIAEKYFVVGRYAQASVVLKRACALYAAAGVSGLGGLAGFGGAPGPATAAACRVRLAETLVELRETEAAVGELVTAHTIDAENEAAPTMLIDLYTELGEDAKAEKFRLVLAALEEAREQAALAD